MSIHYDATLASTEPAPAQSRSQNGFARSRGTADDDLTHRARVDTTAHLTHTAAQGRDGASARRDEMRSLPPRWRSGAHKSPFPAVRAATMAGECWGARRACGRGRGRAVRLARCGFGEPWRLSAHFPASPPPACRPADRGAGEARAGSPIGAVVGVGGPRGRCGRPRGRATRGWAGVAAREGVVLCGAARVAVGGRGTGAAPAAPHPVRRSPSSRRRSPCSTRTAMAPSPPRSWVSGVCVGVVGVLHAWPVRPRPPVLAASQAR